MFYVEFTIKSLGYLGEYISIGLARKIENVNTYNATKQYSFFLRCTGEFATSNGSFSNYCKKSPQGTKLGMLFDLFRGNIKYFINDVDQGYAVENNSDLM